MRPALLLVLAAACGGDRPIRRPPPSTSVSDTSAPTATLVQHGEVSCDRNGPLGYDETVIATDVMDPVFLHGAALGVGDLDGDGQVDLFLPERIGSRVLLGRGTQLETVVPGLDLPDVSAVSLADHDGDGDLDVFVSVYGAPDLLLRNDWPQLVDVAAEAGVAGGALHSLGSAWGDMDGDGDLDLVVAGHGHVPVADGTLTIDMPADPARLYENRGDGTFADRSERLPARAHDAWTFVPTWTHLNDDGRPDLLFANDFPQFDTTFPLLQTADGSFVDDDSLGLSVAMAAMGTAIEDLNDDGWDDVFFPAWSANALLLSSTADVWVNHARAMNVDPVLADKQVVGWGAAFGDADNDGDLDLAMGYGEADLGIARNPDGSSLVNPAEQPDELFRNDGLGFARVAEVVGVDWSGSTRALLMVDLDQDGWLDMVRRDLNGRLVIHRSRCNDSAWLAVSLRDEGGPNPFGVGATVEVSDGAHTRRRVVRAGGTSISAGGPPEVHVGLGTAVEVDLVVRWPDGRTSAFEGVPTRQHVTVRAR